MRGEKRKWLYTGLGVPDGVGLVRRRLGRSRQPTAERRILLCGDPLAAQLFPSFAKLAKTAGAALHVDVRDVDSAHEWAKGGWLQAHLATFRPTTVLLALDPRDLLARRLITLRVERHGAKLLWLVPPGVRCPEEPGFAAAPDPTVAALAAWTGRLWGMVE